MGVAQAKKMTAQTSINEVQMTDTIFTPIASVFNFLSIYIGGVNQPAHTKYKRLTTFSHQSHYFQFLLCIGVVFAPQVRRGGSTIEKITQPSSTNEAKMIETIFAPIRHLKFHYVYTMDFASQFEKNRSEQTYR